MLKFIQKQKNKLIFAAVVIVSIVLLSGYSSYNAQTARQALLADLPRVTVSKSNLEKVVYTSGTIEAENKRVVVAPLSSEVQEVLVTANQQVTKDQVLFKLKSKNQFNKEVTTDVKSPIAGKITATTVQVGDLVAAGQSVLAQIADFSSLYISAEVSEAEVNLLKLEQNARVEIKSLANLKTTGKVSFIAIAPVQAAPGSASGYQFKVRFNEVPEGAKIGLSANVEIVYDQKIGVIALDDSYIYRRDGKSYVQKVLPTANTNNSEAIEEFEVEPGFSGETSVEIISGLQEGDTVILPDEQIRQQRGQLNFFGGN
jgi:multidrug efflux pump subunit AcrA (membrane-fusion protein)